MTATSDHSERYLTIAQLSEKLGGRSRASLHRDRKEGRIPEPIYLGNKPLWRESDVDAAMDALANEDAA